MTTRTEINEDIRDVINVLTDMNASLKNIDNTLKVILIHLEKVKPKDGDDTFLVTE